MAASPLKTSEENIERKMENVSNTQDSIQSLSLWVIHNRSNYKRIVDVWFKVLKKSSTKHRLTLFNLCNDVAQNGKRKKAAIYIDGFKDILKEAVYLVRDNSIKNNVQRILKIWTERNIFSKDFIKELQQILDSASPAPPVTTSASYTPTATSTIPTATTASSQSRSYTKIPVDPKILAEFKPQTLIDKINNFKRMEGEVELKRKQLSNLKLDASSIEAVKLLKDRSHGKQFSKQFEDSCYKLEDCVACMRREIEERKNLIDLMEKSEMFYDEQYREAKIVANAYKNFGTRINNLRKKLEDLKSSLPSPIPSPSMDAPSPGNTPPQLRPDDNTAVDMELDEDGEQASSNIVSAAPVPVKPNSVEEYNPNDAYIPSTTASYSRTTNSDHKNAPTAFESRIASMMQPSMSLSSGKAENDLVYNPPPVYNPPLPKHRALRAVQAQNGNDQGEGTPVKDEGSSTPVMDEKPDDSPPRSKTKNQNPIDFLTQILSKTTKTSTPGSDFLQNLSLLTNTVKSQFQQNKETSDVSPSQPQGVPPVIPNQVPGTVTSPSQQATPPNSWAEWKAQRTPVPPQLPPSPAKQHIIPQQPPLGTSLQPPMSQPPAMPMSQPPNLPVLTGPPNMPQLMPVMSHPNPPLSRPPPPTSQASPALNIPSAPIMRPVNPGIVSPPVSGPPPLHQSPILPPRAPFTPVSTPSPSQHQPMPPPSPQHGLQVRPGGWMPQQLPQSQQPPNQPFQQPARFLGPSPPGGFQRPGDQGSPTWQPPQPPLTINQPPADSELTDTPTQESPTPVTPPVPKGILRNRKSSLREVPLTSESGDLSAGGGDAYENIGRLGMDDHLPRPPSQPPSPTEPKTPRLAKQNSDSSAGSVPDDHREFLEKLKKKTAGNTSLVAPPSVDPQDDETKRNNPVFSRHPARSNLTTITPVDFEDEQQHNSESGVGEDVHVQNIGNNDDTNNISTISTIDRSDNRSGHDPDDIRHLDNSGRQDDVYRPPRHEYYDRRPGHYDNFPPPPARPREYYDSYRDPYYRRDFRGGPPPPKRPYYDPYRRPPYYRY